MKICLRTDFCGNDLERVVQFCQGLGEDHIWAFPQLAETYGEDGLMQPSLLQKYHERLRGQGLNLQMISEVLLGEDLASEQAWRDKAAYLCRTLTAMQAAGVSSLFLLVASRAAAGEHERKLQWERLGNLYSEIVAQAEKTRRGIANHGHQTPEYLIFSAADVERLLSLAPSRFNGVTFCAGCFHLAGDDLGHWLERFGKDRIFLVHARDVRRLENGAFEDVFYGKGGVDVKALVSKLKAIGYRGLICPEHLPHVAGDPFDEISAAWGVGYLRALLAE